LAGSGCGGDGGDGGDQTSEAALTVEQVMDFTSDYHAEEPFLATGDEPLTECAWVTAEESETPLGEDVAAAFHCTGGTIDEDGDDPVFVSEYEDEAAAKAGIDDRLLATGASQFLAGGIVVDAQSGFDEPAKSFYEALIAECSCGEIVEI
jgi:hypothetical protein